MHPGVSASINTETENISEGKSCLLCYDKIPEGNGSTSSPKLYELCCKYLRAALILDTLSNPKENQAVLLCLKCFTSASKLANFTDEMDFIQKNVFESVIRFSMEILRRRGKTNGEEIDGTDIKSGNKRGEIDVSSLPNFNFWTGPTSSGSSAETIFKNNYYGQIEGPLSVSGYGGNENSAEFTAEEAKLKNSLDNCLGEGFVNFSAEIQTPKLDTLKNIDQTLMLKLQRQKYHNDGRNGIATDVNIFGRDDSKKEEINKSIWTGTKYDLGRSYKVTGECPTVPYGRCNGELGSQPQFHCPINPPTNSTETSVSQRPSTTEEEKASRHQAESLYGSSIQNESNSTIARPSASKAFQRKSSLELHARAQIGTSPFHLPHSFDSCNTKGFEKRHKPLKHRKLRAKTQFKCLMCGKEFVWKSDLVRHARSHTGEKPFKCDMCEFSSNQYAHLKLHKNRKHSTLTSFRCKQCGKYFKTTVDVKQHFKRVHFALDFSDDYVMRMT